LGLTPFVDSQPHDTIPEETDWQAYRREYAVLHVFDEDGNHLYTKHWYGGTTAECDGEKLKEKLQEMIDELGEVEYTDIAIKVFHTQIDGFMFGFEVNEDEETVRLLPSDIMFMEPWNGEYYT
jgi:formate hydrogenlyase regulatory protein HycA